MRLEVSILVSGIFYFDKRAAGWFHSLGPPLPVFTVLYFTNTILSSGTRFDDGAGGDNEVQRTMLELINQLDGFDPRGNIKVLMATNRSR